MTGTSVERLARQLDMLEQSALRFRRPIPRPSPARIVPQVPARGPFLRPEVAPEVPCHTLDDVPELKLREPLGRDAAPPENETEEVPRDRPRAVGVPAVVDGGPPGQKQSRRVRTLLRTASRTPRVGRALLAVQLRPADLDGAARWLWRGCRSAEQMVAMTPRLDSRPIRANCTALDTPRRGQDGHPRLPKLKALGRPFRAGPSHWNPFASVSGHPIGVSWLSLTSAHAVWGVRIGGLEGQSALRSQQKRPSRAVWTATIGVSKLSPPSPCPVQRFAMEHAMKLSRLLALAVTTSVGVAAAQGPDPKSTDGGSAAVEHPSLQALPHDFPLPAPPAPPAWSGGASPYLIGTWDNRNGQTTLLHVINPTGQRLTVLVAFFDDNEAPLGCFHTELTPNDVLEIDTRKTPGQKARGWGVVKIVALDPQGRPQIGLVGNQRRTALKREEIAYEAPLHNIQPDVLVGDWPLILRACKR